MGGARAFATFGGVACFAFACVASCSDLDGLTSAGADDAGTDGDASLAPVADSSSAADAANDAGNGDASDANVAAFCSQVDAAFCDDFEQGTVGVGWTSVIARATGSLEHVSGGPPGSNRALRVSFDTDGAAPGGPSAFLVKTWSGAPSTVKCAADIWIEKMASSDTTVFYLSLLHSGGWVGFGLDVTPNGSNFWLAGDGADGGPLAGGHALVGDVPLLTWHHVQIETDFVNATFRIDNAVPILHSLPALTRTGYEVNLGIDTELAGPTSGAARIDNVVCHVTP